jgi:hypothetical protein
MKHLIERFEKQNLSLAISQSLEGSRSHIARAEKIVSKARFKKPEFYYRFKNYENMIQYLESFVLNLEKIQERKENAKNMKKKASSEFNHEFFVGQILYESWGYEQTNIKYYQIIGFKGKSAILQRIQKKIVQETSWASAMVEPCRNEFIYQPFVKRIVPSVGYSGSISYHITMGGCVGSLFVHKEGSQNYCSWYA